VIDDETVRSSVEVQRIAPPKLLISVCLAPCSNPHASGAQIKSIPMVATPIGTDVAGILGALLAIPVAGSIQVIIRELLQHRDERRRSAVMG